MQLLNKIKHGVRRSFKKEELDPEAAYDLWAAGYDDQPGNLMFVLDEEIFSKLLGKIQLKNKVVLDVGCGTGRHWQTILDCQPLQLIGCDVSKEMLGKLKIKYPAADLFQVHSNSLPEIADNSCDIVISNLALAHIEDVKAALAAWERIVRKNGTVLITDYHPDALTRGADRSFIVNGKMVFVKNYVHSIENISGLFKENGFEIECFEERRIDDSVRLFYEAQNALHVFNKFKDTPIIYGMLLKKKDDFA